MVLLVDSAAGLSDSSSGVSLIMESSDGLSLIIESSDGLSLIIESSDGLCRTSSNLEGVGLGVVAGLSLLQPVSPPTANSAMDMVMAVLRVSTVMSWLLVTRSGAWEPGSHASGSSPCCRIGAPIWSVAQPKVKA